MSKKQAIDLQKSLKKFGLVEIPVIDTENRVIAGNMRVSALCALGRDDEIIEVRVPSRPLTIEESNEYLLRSNKNTGSWDIDELANFNTDLLLDVGWEKEDLCQMFSLLGEESLEEVVEKIVFFKKSHVLLSFFPELLLKIQPFLEQIKSIEGVEFEQSAS
jgi:hypothetical protein